MRFHPYHLLGDTPNVIVDGSATASTVLTLSHWPGSPTPVELLDDLSAQIVVRAIQQGALPAGVEAVSNNHFDQDGLASLALLVHGDDAWQRREPLVDLARAGDFGTFADRGSIRVAMALAAFDDPDRSPLPAATFAGDYPAQCAALYEATLPRVLAMVDDPDSVRAWWADEDAHLDASLAALADGSATVADVPDLDLAVVTVPDGLADRLTTRFTVTGTAALHPAAINSTTERMRVLTMQHGRYRLELRYETWVMFRSRVLTPRPDLRPLAARLNDREGVALWTADPPGALTPALTCGGGGSSLTPEVVRAEVEAYLRTAEPAWDPLAGR